jgi:tetratricopeptide (TPR) repeat protein
MRAENKEKVFDFQPVLILSCIFIIFVFLGCGSGDKGNIRGVNQIPENKMLSNFPEELRADKFPEMNSDEYERLGDALLSKRNLHLAFLQYERSLQLNPHNLRVEYKKGLVLLLGGKNDDAIGQFQTVLEKDPEFALTYEGLGRAFFQKKKYDEAEIHFLKALALEPQLWKSHNFLGNVYDFQRRYEGAVREYKSALAIKPDNGLIYNNLGVSYSLAGKYKKAADAFHASIKLKYTESKVYNNLGLALANIERYSDALEAFKKGGGEARAYNNLGCVYLRQGKFEEAIHCFERAIEIEPGFYARASENLKKAKAGNGQL